MATPSAVPHAPPVVRKPTAVLVSTADACRVGCRFCFRADRGSDVLDLATYARALSRLKELGIHEVCLSGGEPTDHAGFRDLVRISLQFGLPVSTVTAAREGVRAERLTSAAGMLSWITLSADSAQAGRLGGVNRSLATALPLIRQLPRGRVSLHLTCWNLSAEEVDHCADIVLRTGVRLEISPLLPSERFSPVADRGSLTAQWANDQKLLLSRFTLSDALSKNLEGYTSPFDPTAPASVCASSRLYLSASGEIRRCPYDHERGISIWADRSEMEARVQRLFTHPSRTARSCLGICHS
ncbi:radical SAM protein [Streptomyces spectabilis]|uniref:radical SAM protein n=1 Tax=Streptomyces spectabilis TaxID=68270 RepID=UPI00340159FF